MYAAQPETFADSMYSLHFLHELHGEVYFSVFSVNSVVKRFCSAVSPANAGSKMLFENFINLETSYVQRLSKVSGMYPQMTQIDADVKPGIFTTEGAEGTEGKPIVSECTRLNRKHSLTPCILFISFMNFMVKCISLCSL